MIDQEAQYDGFYCICTDLLGPADEVIRLNSERWIVENDFRITRGRTLIDNYSDYQIDTLTKGDSKGSPLVRHFLTNSTAISGRAMMAIVALIGR